MIIEYTVSDKTHRIIKGTIEASSTLEGAKILKEKGYLVIKISQKQTLTDFYFKYAGRQKVTLKFNQLVDFTRQMGIMVNAGLSLVDSLAILQKQSTSPAYSTLVTRILERIKSGDSFSNALQQFSDTFKGYYISLVKAGESSGKLDEVLLRLADNLEKSREFRGKVIGALIYPVIVVIGMAIVAFVMMTFVLPQLLDLYKNFNVELPITTQMLMGTSEFLQKFWPLVILVVAGTAVYFSIAIRSPKFKLRADTLSIKLPVFGKIIRQSVLVESTRTLSILLHSGVPLLEALQIVTSTTSNLVYQHSFLGVQRNVERGVSLGDALASEEVFPEILVQMTAVGEKTGQLDDTLMRISKFFQMETELAVKTATTLIEPIILVVLGIGVGILIVSVLTPIYNLTSSFGMSN